MEGRISQRRLIPTDDSGEGAAPGRFGYGAALLFVTMPVFHGGWEPPLTSWAQAQVEVSDGAADVLRNRHPYKIRWGKRISLKFLKVEIYGPR